MAEVVVLAAVRKIGVALVNEAINHVSLQFRMYTTQLTELHRSMRRIGIELSLMHEYIYRMDIRNRKSRGYGIWVQHVIQLGHEIEDNVDEYVYLVGQKHDTGWSVYLKEGFKHPSVMFSLNRIASLVKEAEINLAYLFKAKDRWVSMEGGGNTSESSYIIESSQHLASISRSLGDEDLVVVDNENRKKLEQLLAGDDMECFVILHGMGGLGKTTLAENIYREKRKEFDCHAWVSISQTYSIKYVLNCLITELYKERNGTPGKIDDMNLLDELKTFLRDKKYLIVLDDVWDPKAVSDLFGAVQNNKGSRVIVTTRIDNVVHLAIPKRIVTLEPLSADESSKLFCETVFPRDTNSRCPEELDGCPKELTALVQQIISKCKGIPLAIVTVGRLLSMRDKTKEEFKRICDQLEWDIINNPSMKHVRNILYLSYIYLPTYLKSCFLYCSLFPEDFVFRRKTLVRWWIAEGFIEEKGESTLEEVAEGYLNELVRSNMLQLAGKNSFDRMNRFKMHDILRELAVDICHKDCFGVTYEEEKCRGFLENVGRRLVVHKLKKDIEQSFSGMHCLRSFITLDRSMPISDVPTSIAKKSRYMSVLDLRGLPIENIPNDIGDLFNLRYFSLRETKVELLPDSIEKLTNLLTLDLLRSNIKELPGGITKLKKLRHLFAERLFGQPGQNYRSQCGVLIPEGLGNLTRLQTLKALDANGESIEHLGELKELRSLKIGNVKGSNCPSLGRSLVQMRFLTNLSVSAYNENEYLSLEHLPSNLQKLWLRGRLPDGMLEDPSLLQAAEQNLHFFSLDWSQLEKDPLLSLSRLSNLTQLNLTKAYNGVQLVFLTAWFPKLKRLYLKEMPCVERLEIKEGAMANLENLVLRNLSPKVLLGIEFLVKLQHLNFLEITNDFLNLLHQRSITGVVQWNYSLRPGC